MNRDNAILLVHTYRILAFFISYFVGGLWLGALAFLLLNERSNSLLCLVGFGVCLYLPSKLATQRDRLIVEHKMTLKELNIDEDEEQPTDEDDLDGAA